MENETDREKFGEDIAYGMQQTLACWATDFIDPYVGKWFQDRFKDDQHQGTLKHTWGGEIIGDSAAFFMFLGVQRFIPQPVQWLKRTAKKCFNPLYDWTGKRNLKLWAEGEHVDENSAPYQQKLEAWKEFQANNFAKSSVISVSSIAANVATQKMMGNTHKLSVITASKVIGAAITMSTMLGLRFAIPKSTQQLDEELSERYFAPLIRRTQELLGADSEDKTIESEKIPADKTPLKSHSRKISEQKNAAAAHHIVR